MQLPKIAERNHPSVGQEYQEVAAGEETCGRHLTANLQMVGEVVAAAAAAAARTVPYSVAAVAECCTEPAGCCTAPAGGTGPFAGMLADVVVVGMPSVILVAGNNQAVAGHCMDQTVVSDHLTGTAERIAAAALCREVLAAEFAGEVIAAWVAEVEAEGKVHDVEEVLVVAYWYHLK